MSSTTISHLTIDNPTDLLLLLRHSSKCKTEDGECTVTPYCGEIKRLWKHIARCTDTECQVPHCLSSRHILSHYRRCKCPCSKCDPVKEAIRQENGGVIINNDNGHGSNNDNEGEKSSDNEEESNDEETDYELDVESMTINTSDAVYEYLGRFKGLRDGVPKDVVKVRVHPSIVEVVEDFCHLCDQYPARKQTA